MEVLLVGAELEENLALRYLAAALENGGHTARFATFDRPADTDQVLEAVRVERPAMVGMSMTFQFRAKEFGALAQALRDDGDTGHITGGGHFPTFAWQECLSAFPAIDSIVRHEGEQTIVEMCNAIERGAPLAGIRGVAHRAGDGIVANEPRALAEALDELPFPKRIGQPQLHLGIPAAFLVGTRGCFGHCTFCCIHAYLKSAGGQMYRWRSPEDVADEMAELRHKRGTRMFVFHDDDFFTRDHAHDHARLVALRDALRKRAVDDVAVVVKARPDDVDERVFDVLQEIGLLRVYLGIEAGSTQGLRMLGRGVDIAQNRRALELLRARDIYMCFNMLIFDPESRISSLRESLAFLREYADVPMNFCRAEIYVGTPLMTKLAREGRLRGDVFGWDYAIREPAAERAFRVFAQAFLDRNFRCDGLMNTTLGLGYHLHLLRTFYPHAMTPSLRELVLRTTRAVNLDCNDKMLEIVDFAQEPASLDPARLADFTAKMTERVTAANVLLEARVAEATAMIQRAAATPKGVKPSRTVSRWGILSAATIALAPLACDRSTGTGLPPGAIDPLPPPTEMPPHPKPPDAGMPDAEPPPTETMPPYVVDPLSPPFSATAVDPPPPPVTATEPPPKPHKPHDAGKKPPPHTGRGLPPGAIDPLPPPNMQRKDAGPQEGR
ncbi:MAG: B12-binding domain-containing radical SAM protein [Polyangiaceae bacterium]|nr:B12-binding domain-containing radical SAM protein [Polyangiaceae bacterium]